VGSRGAPSPGCFPISPSLTPPPSSQLRAEGQPHLRSLQTVSSRSPRTPLVLRAWRPPGGFFGGGFLGKRAFSRHLKPPSVPTAPPQSPPPNPAPVPAPRLPATRRRSPSSPASAAAMKKQRRRHRRKPAASPGKPPRSANSVQRRGSRAAPRQVVAPRPGR